MKQLFMAFLVLILGSQSVYGMKRIRPYSAVKNQILDQIGSGNLDAAYKRYRMHEGMFKRFSFSAQEKKDLRNSLVEEIHTVNEELVNDSFSTLRSNFWWILPASATLVATAQAPALIGLGVIGSALGSFGFKKQCDYLANSMMYQKLCAKANTLEKMFSSKESELK